MTNRDNAPIGCFLFVWLLGLGFYLGLLGVIIWAIISLVNHYT